MDKLLHVFYDTQRPRLCEHFTQFSITTTHLLAATCRIHFLRTHRRVWRSPCPTSLFKQGQLVLCSSDIFKRDALANTSYCLNTSQKVNLTSMPSRSSQANKRWKKKRISFCLLALFSSEWIKIIWSYYEVSSHRLLNV